MAARDVHLQRERFETTLREGIACAKAGEHYRARRLLELAIEIDGTDARPYLWLSGTTENPEERLDFLEKAMAMDPNNVAARRGLALLTGRVDPARLALALGTPEPEPELQAGEAQEVGSNAFRCSRCGGRMAYQVETAALVCEYCGQRVVAGPDADAQSDPYLADRHEEVLDFVIPTRSGHAWVMGQAQMICSGCGAASVVPSECLSTQCPYCGANTQIGSPLQADWIDPHLVLPVKVDPRQAKKNVREWLGSGWFTPEDLSSAVKNLRLRPGYYSAWSFDGTIEVRWNCEIKHGSGRSAVWERQNGTEMRFFNDVLAPGVKAVAVKDLAALEPFHYQEAVQFEPGLLAGWPAVVYDRSLNEASLMAREKVIKIVRRDLQTRLSTGQEMRNFSTGGGSWSGMTFKHLLMPLWTGVYAYRGKDYRVFVNGQTGKVAGTKPRDPTQVALAVVAAALVLLLLGLLALIVFGSAAVRI